MDILHVLLSSTLVLIQVYQVVYSVYICIYALHSEVEQWNITFPKPKPELKQEPIKSNGQTFTVLQLSDWHIDLDYQVSYRITL